MKEEKQLRKWEHLEDRRCLVCQTPFVAKIYWAYGGKNISWDKWIISSVYCSTKCRKKAEKLFKEAD